VTALKRAGNSVHFALVDLSTNSVRELAVIRSDRTIVPITHVYNRWVVGVFGDTVMGCPIDRPDRLYVYKTENAAWISQADLYNTALVIRSVPVGKKTNDELPPIQINLDQLVREPGARR